MIAITGQGKTRGTAAVLGIEATINQHIAYISPRSTIVLPDYLQMSLIAAYSSLRALSDDSGSTKGALTCEDLKHFRVALPPCEEQNRLIVAVRGETAAIEISLEVANREIDLIREYRTRLIADVVTGKLDVREAAARLSDEIEEPEPFEEVDGRAEGDEESESVDLETSPEEAIS